MQKKLPNPVVVEEIQTIFANRSKEIQDRIKKHGIREDAGDDCVAWILVTMIRHAGGYDPSIATVEAYVFGRLKWLCREYKKPN